MSGAVTKSISNAMGHLLPLLIAAAFLAAAYFGVKVITQPYQDYQTKEEFVTAGEGFAYFLFLIGGLIALSAFFMDGNAGQVVIPLGFGVAMLGTLILK